VSFGKHVRWPIRSSARLHWSYSLTSRIL